MPERSRSATGRTWRSSSGWPGGRGGLPSGRSPSITSPCFSPPGRDSPRRATRWTICRTGWISSSDSRRRPRPGRNSSSPPGLSPYYSAWLDSLMQTSGLVWFGCGNRKISFAFSDDLELFLDRERGGSDAGSVGGAGPAGSNSPACFPRKSGATASWTSPGFAKMDSRAVTEKLWNLAWQGRSPTTPSRPSARGS